MLGLFVARARHRRWRSGCSSGALGVQALRRARWRRAGLYPVASLAIAALAFGAADVLHGSGFLAVYIAGLALGSAQIPARAHDRGLSRGARMGRPDRRCSSSSVCWSFPGSSATSRSRAPSLRWCSCSSRGRSRCSSRRRSSGFSIARAAHPRLGGAARRRARRACDLPGDPRRSAQPRVLQHRLLRRAALDPRCRARRSSRSRSASG